MEGSSRRDGRVHRHRHAGTGNVQIGVDGLKERDAISRSNDRRQALSDGRFDGSIQVDRNLTTWADVIGIDVANGNRPSRNRRDGAARQSGKVTVGQHLPIGEDVVVTGTAIDGIITGRPRERIVERGASEILKVAERIASRTAGRLSGR